MASTGIKKNLKNLLKKNKKNGWIKAVGGQNGLIHKRNMIHK